MPKQIKNNTIPKMIHPLSKHWKQPDSKNILIDDTHALLTQSDFDMLATYSTSIPSGVYEGKMWKGQWSDGWFLKWYVNKDEKYCSTHSRKIIII
jgi:hypothetical protein